MTNDKTTSKVVELEKVFTYSQVEKMLEEAFVDGFEQTSNNWNAESPFEDSCEEITFDKIGGEFYTHNIMRKILK